MLIRLLVGFIIFSIVMETAFAQRPASAYGLAPYAPVARPITIEETIFENDKGESVRGERGFIAVPEIRGAQSARELSVAFIRIKARTQNPAPPVVLLHGGPSEDGIIQSRASRIQVLTEMRDVADLILIDGRGLGLSTPTLKCRIEQPRFVFDVEQMRRMYEEEGLKCRDHWERQGVVLDGYNPVALADDAADLMVSLGYERFSVMGNSYGAYWSIALAKRHPDLIHRIAISGIFGLDGSFNLPSDAQAAFDDLLPRLEDTKAAKDLFGKRGLTRAFHDIMERLDKNPVAVEVEVFGRSETLTFDTHTVARILYFAEATQHREGASQLPRLIYALDKKAYRGVAQLLAGRFEKRVSKKPLHHGLSSVSIICNQVNTAQFLDRFEREKKSPPSAFWMGQVMTRRNAAYACDEVGYPRIGAEWAASFESDAPVFAVIGSFDGNTPPEGARRTLANFSDVKSVVFNGAGHRHREIERLWPELADYRRRFMAGDNLDDLPPAVELPPVEAASLPWHARLLFNIGLGDFILTRM